MWRRVSRLIGVPSQRTSPASAASTPSAMRMVVVLPAPLLPTKPNSSPARTSNVVSRKATTSPYRLEMPSISSRPSPTVRSPPRAQRVCGEPYCVYFWRSEPIPNAIPWSSRHAACAPAWFGCGGPAVPPAARIRSAVASTSATWK